MKVTFEIPNELVGAITQNREHFHQDLLVDFVCGLYADWKINSGQAARWLNIPRIQFWEELGKRRIPRQITPEMIQDDASLALCHADCQ